MSHILTETKEKVEDFKKPDYLLRVADKVAPRGSVLDLTLLEIDEVTEALNGNDPVEAPREVADVVVLYFSWMLIHAPDIKVADNLTGVNGYGRHSNAWEGLQQTVFDSQDDPHAIRETLRRIWSIVIWNPFALQGLQQMDAVILKVQSNYPPALFTAFDPVLQRISTPDEALSRYEHYRKMLRLIRNSVQRTLLHEDWQPHLELLQSWQDSNTSYQLLLAQLENKKKA